MARPTFPRITVPLNYALVDDLGKFRALTETFGAAVRCYLKAKFSDEENLGVSLALELIRMDGWDIVGIKPIQAITDGKSVINWDDAVTPASEDDAVFWVPLAHQRPRNPQDK